LGDDHLSWEESLKEPGAETALRGFNSSTPALTRRAWRR